MPAAATPRLKEEIYKLSEQGLGQSEIAGQVGVSLRTVQRVLQRAKPYWRQAMRLQLTPDAVAEVRRLYEEKDQWGRRVYSFRRLGKIFGVSSTTVSNAVNRLEAYQGEGLSVLEQPATPEEQDKIKASLDRLMKDIGGADTPKKPFPV